MLKKTVGEVALARIFPGFLLFPSFEGKTFETYLKMVVINEEMGLQELQH